MHCKICNSIIKYIVWNEDLNDWEVCADCLESINTTFEDPVIEDEGEYFDDDCDIWDTEEEDYEEIA